jgi:hypothetical protein
MSDSLKLDLSKFEDVTVRTAKCNVCNNKDFVHRCLQCRASWCSRCRSLNDHYLGHPLAHFNCDHSPVELAGDPQKSPQAWWIRNPPSYRSPKPGAPARPEPPSNLHHITKYPTTVPKGNSSTPLSIRLRYGEEAPSMPGPVAVPARRHFALPFREATGTKKIDNSVGRGRGASTRRPSPPHILSVSRKRQRSPSPEPELSTLDLSDHDSDIIHTEPMTKKSRPEVGDVSGYMGADRIMGAFVTPSRKSEHSGRGASKTTRVNHSIWPKPATQQPERPYVSQPATYPDRSNPSETPARDPQTSALLNWSAPMRNAFSTNRYGDSELQGVGPCRYTDPITGELMFTVQTHGRYRWIHFGRNSESIGIYRESPTERSALVDREFVARIDPTAIGSEPVVGGRDIAMTVRGITPGSERLDLITDTSGTFNSVPYL